MHTEIHTFAALLLCLDISWTKNDQQALFDLFRVDVFILNTDFMSKTNIPDCPVFQCVAVVLHRNRISVQPEAVLKVMAMVTEKGRSAFNCFYSIVRMTHSGSGASY